MTYEILSHHENRCIRLHRVCEQVEEYISKHFKVADNKGTLEVYTEKPLNIYERMHFRVAWFCQNELDVKVEFYATLTDSNCMCSFCNGTGKTNY